MKLNRFSEARQDQIEQLIAYAELLGLSGRDLVAIGGKLDRDQSKSKKIANMEIVRSFECLPIGKDHSLDNRFKLKTLNGAYNFECVDGWATWQVTSLKTKVKQTHSSGMWNYQFPKSSYQKLSKYSLLLDIAAGKIPLNF